MELASQAAPWIVHAEPRFTPFSCTPELPTVSVPPCAVPSAPLPRILPPRNTKRVCAGELASTYIPPPEPLAVLRTSCEPRRVTVATPAANTPPPLPPAEFPDTSDAFRIRRLLLLAWRAPPFPLAWLLVRLHACSATNARPWA